MNFMCISYKLEALEMNENSETGYIFGTEIPKPVEDERILWASSRQVEVEVKLPSPPPPPPPPPPILGKLTTFYQY